MKKSPKSYQIVNGILALYGSRDKEAESETYKGKSFDQPLFDRVPDKLGIFLQTHLL